MNIRVKQQPLRCGFLEDRRQKGEDLTRPWLYLDSRKAKGQNTRLSPTTSLRPQFGLRRDIRNLSPAKEPRCGIISQFYPRRAYATRRGKGKSIAGPALESERKRPNPFLDNHADVPDLSVESDQKNPADADACYKHYLGKEIRRHKGASPRCKWLSTLHRRQCRAALPPVLARDPLLVLEQADSDDFEQIKLCLGTFIADAHASAPTKSEAQKVLREARAGTKALRWLRERPHLFDDRVVPEFIDYIVHCLVAEDADQIMWHWLSVAHKINSRDIWKGMTVRSFLENKLFWNEEPRILNQVLAEFLRMADTTRPGEYTLWCAASWLSRQLLFDELGAVVDVRLYDRYVDRLSKWIKDPKDLERNFVRFRLHRPTSPDPLPALRFIQHNMPEENRTPFVQHLFKPKDGRTASMVFLFLIREAQVLHRAGYVAESHSVLDFGKHILPKYFDMGQLVNHYRHLKAELPMRLAHLEGQGEREGKVDQVGIENSNKTGGGSTNALRLQGGQRPNLQF